MKFIKNLTTAILVAALLVVSVCAAGVVPSAELGGAPSISHTNGGYLAAIRDANGKVIANVPAGQFSVAAASESTVEAAKDLNLSGVSGFSTAWANGSGGAPVTNAVVVDVFEVSVTGAAAAALAGNTITFSVNVTGMNAGDEFVVLYNNGGWKVADAVFTSASTLKITAAGGGTFVIVGDNGALPPQLPGKSSPSTGVTLVSSIAMLGIALCGSTAVVAGKKLSKREDA